LPSMSLQIRRRRSVFVLSDEGQLEAETLELKGRVEAATIGRLQKEIMDLMWRKNCNVIVNLRSMEYSTSTGFGAILQLNNRLEKQGGRLSILGPSPEVLHVLELLGVDEVIPIFKDEKDLCERYLSIPRRSIKIRNEQMDLAMHRAEASLGATESRFKDKGIEVGQVVMAAPEENFFFIILTERLEKQGCKVQFATTAREAFKLVRESNASALLVDYSLKQYEELCLNVKSEPTTSSCSIIKVYPEGKKPGRGEDLSIIPNQHVEEPCSVDQIATFLLSEIRRHQSEGQYFNHELYFGIPSSPNMVAKAARYVERVLNSSGAELECQKGAVIAGLREAMDNARRHGHRENDKLHIRVLFLRDRDKITLVVKDEGNGFDYESVLEKLEKENATDVVGSRPLHMAGGLGISLMKKSSTQIKYNDLGNEVSLIFSLSPEKT